MIVLSWNVTDLKSIPRQKVARDLVVSHSPDVVFNQEMKLSVDSMLDRAPRIWAHVSYQCIGARDSSGGLACFWDSRKVVPLQWISCHSFISLIASTLGSGEICMFTNVYAPTNLLGKT